MSLGKRLDSLRKEKGVSKYRLAKDIGVPVSTVRSWINSQINPREPNIEKLEKYFKVHPAWLRYGDEVYAKKPEDRSSSTTRKIRMFAEEHPEGIPYLEDVIELFMKEYKKTSPFKRA